MCQSLEADRHGYAIAEPAAPAAERALRLAGLTHLTVSKPRMTPLNLSGRFSQKMQESSSKWQGNRQGPCIWHKGRVCAAAAVATSETLMPRWSQMRLPWGNRMPVFSGNDTRPPRSPRGHLEHAMNRSLVGRPPPVGVFFSRPSAPGRRFVRAPGRSQAGGKQGVKTGVLKQGC